MDNINTSSFKWTKKAWLIVVSATMTIMAITFGTSASKAAKLTQGSDGGVNEIVMNSDNAPTQSASYGNINDYAIRYANFDYFGAMQPEVGNHVKLATNGYIGNDVGTRLTSITSITVTYSASASMEIALSNRDDGLGLNQRVAIASGVELEPTNAPYYFRLYANDVVTDVVSVQICYTCVEHSASTYFLENLANQYTGTLGGTVFSLTRSGSSAVLATLNLASNISISDGVISVVQDEITVSATGLTYVGTLSDNGRLITYKSASGAYAAYVNGLNLTSVYNLENFESYDATGLGIRQAATGYYGHTGLRGAYYSDYYAGSGTSPIGGTGWQLMGSADYLDRYTSANEIHTGNSAGKMKRSTIAMRHVSWDLYTGAAVVVGKGDTMSLWAKGVASDVTIKPRVSYVSQITAANNQGTSDTATETFIVPANSDWTQYTFSIDPTRAVYGILFTLEWGSTVVYLPVDDIQIYTSGNPWATYVAPVAVTGVSVTPETLSLTVGQVSTLTATVAPANATNKNVVWSSDDESVTVDSNGQISAVYAGGAHITATTVDGSYADSCNVSVAAVSNSADDPLTRTYSGTVSILSNTVSVTAALAENYVVYMKIGSDVINSTYTIDDNVVTVVTGNANYGTFVGSLNEARTVLTKTSLSGTYAGYIGDLIMNVSSYVLEDGNNTTTAALQSKYSIQYSDSWLTSSSADRIEYHTANKIEGDGSVKLKNGSFGKMRYKSANLTTSLGNYKAFGMWVYNATGSTISAQCFIYTVNGASFNNFATFSIPSNSTWTYYTAGFTAQVVAGWSIILPTASVTGYPCIDYVNLAS